MQDKVPLPPSGYELHHWGGHVEQIADGRYAHHQLRAYGAACAAAAREEQAKEIAELRQAKAKISELEAVNVVNRGDKERIDWIERNEISVMPRWHGWSIVSRLHNTGQKLLFCRDGDLRFAIDEAELRALKEGLNKMDESQTERLHWQKMLERVTAAEAALAAAEAKALERAAQGHNFWVKPIELHAISDGIAAAIRALAKQETPK